MRFLWVYVTDDKFEFPIYIEDTARQLAEKVGTTTNNVISCVKKTDYRAGASSRYKKIKWEEDDGR